VIVSFRLRQTSFLKATNLQYPFDLSSSNFSQDFLGLADSPSASFQKVVRIMKVGIYYEHDQSLVGVEVDDAAHVVTDRHQTEVKGLSDQTDSLIQSKLYAFEAWLIEKMNKRHTVFWQLPMLSTGSSIPGNQTGLMEAKKTTIELQKIYHRHKTHPIGVERELSLTEEEKNIVRITFCRRDNADIRAILIAYDAMEKKLKNPKSGLLNAFQGCNQYKQACLLIATFARDKNKNKFTFSNYVETIKRFENNNKNTLKVKAGLGANLKKFQDQVDQAKTSLEL